MYENADLFVVFVRFVVENKKNGEIVLIILSTELKHEFRRVYAHAALVLGLRDVSVFSEHESHELHSKFAENLRRSRIDQEFGNKN